VFTSFAIIEYAFVNYTSFNHTSMTTTVENNILDIMARLYFNFQKTYAPANKVKGSSGVAMGKRNAINDGQPLNAQFGRNQTVVAPPPALQAPQN
jgi:hypothetical protein